MGAPLVASLQLNLKDELSRGLENIQNMLKGLRDVGLRLTLGKLGNGEAEDALERVSNATRGLVTNLKHVVTNAGAAHAALGRMKAAASGMASHIGAIGTVVSAATLAEPIRSYAGFENLARQSAITKGLSGAAADAETKRLMVIFQKEALGSGQSSETVGEAFLDLVRQGISPDKIESILGVHSRAATAYGISAADLGAPAAALLQTMKITEKDFGGALASMAQAAQSGRFKIGDFSRFLPGIAGTSAKLGMTGRGGADMLFAALETVMKNSSEPGQGATDFTDFLNYITSSMGARSFSLQSRGMGEVQRGIQAKYHLTGFNSDTAIALGAAQGMTPFESIVSELRQKVQGLSPVAMSEALGAYIHDKGARDALVAMLLHLPDYISLKGRLGAANESKLGTDWRTEMEGPQKQLDRMVESLTQLGRMAGHGFLPVLTELDNGLDGLMSALNGLDRIMPGAKDRALAVGGGMLALVAGIGGIGLVWPAFAGGIGLFGSAVALMVTPLGLAFLAVAALSAAGLELYQHWQKFLGFFGLGGKGGPRVGLHPVGGRHNQFDPANLGASEPAPALATPDGPGRHTRAWYLQHKDDDTGTAVSMPAPATSNVKVWLALDESGKIVVRDARSDNPAVQVAAPNINPGPTLGRP